MIRVLVGDDSFAIRERLLQIAEDFGGVFEKVDGTTLARRDLPDLLMGSTLFSEKRLVVIYNLSQNSSLWSALPDWLERVSDDVSLVLVEEKLDKRTQSYKVLNKNSEITEFKTWSDRDINEAVAWLQTRAVKLDAGLSRKIVQRIGMDKWALDNALETLSLVEGTLTDEILADLLPAKVSDNVFSLLEQALSGSGGSRRALETLRRLETSEDPHKLLALLSTQIFQLLAVASAGVGDNPERDFSMHSFVVSKMRQLTRGLNTRQLRRIAEAVASADIESKTTGVDSWITTERLLARLSQIKNTP